MKVPTRLLNNGYKIPLIGLGTWKSDVGSVKAAVLEAIDAGYRHIDCAMVYQNEDQVGAALQQILQAGTVQRNELFIVSKLWNTFHDPALVEGALMKSMKDLCVEYLDLYLIHFPMAYKENTDTFHPMDPVTGKYAYSEVDYVDTWKAMENCVRKGLVRSIGVSNFNSFQLQRILDNCTIKPVTNQVECHPYLNQKKLMDFCSQKEIVVTGYSPFFSPDRPWRKPGEPCLFSEPLLEEVAAKYNKSVAQILLRYQIQRGVVVIAKSITARRIRENIDIFDFQLHHNDMDIIESLNRNLRHCTEMGLCGDHPYYPFNLKE